MSVLSVKDLAIGYEGKAIVSDISFDVNEGDYLCIVGENGAGKTTLIKTLLHLQKPMSGKIEYEEKGIGYLPQQTVVQKDFPASVWEVVLSGNLNKLGLRPFYSSSDKDTARENMEKMGIWDLKKESYKDLSGGQQQRVLLARALCASSKLLFLDEPVSGLDPKATLELYTLLKQINDEKVTIIMVSHDIHAALKYSSHILHIEKKGIFYGTKEEYLNSKGAKNIGLYLVREKNNAGSN